MDLQSIKTLIELGWPAIVTIGFVVLAKEYIRSRDNEVNFLRKDITFLQNMVVTLQTEVKELRAQIETTRHK
jgi:hypothetical protein